MKVLYVILLVVAAICFAAAAYISSRPVTTNGAGQVRPMPHLVALGLLAWVLVPLIQHIDALD